MTGTGQSVSILSLAGTSYYVTSLVEALSDEPEIRKLQVFTPASSPETETLPAQSDTVEVVPLEVSSSLVRSFLDVNRPGLVRNVLTRLSAFDPDVVHIAVEMRVPFHFAPLINRRTEAPIVLTVHEPNPYLPTPIRRHVLNPIQTYNLKALARFTDRYIVHCDALRESLSPHVPDADDIWSIPHGDLSPYFTRWAEGRNSTERDVLFFGRAAPGKGLPNLIEAGKRLVDTLSDVTITIAGSGYDPERFGSPPSEHFTVIDSRISEQDAARLFQRAAVVAMPYLDASASGIPSIAGGFSTPVVASNVGCLPALVKHERGGLIVEPGDSDALYDALLRLLENADVRDELGRELGRIHESEFSWERIAKMTIDVYMDDHAGKTPN